MLTDFGIVGYSQLSKFKVHCLLFFIHFLKSIVYLGNGEPNASSKAPNYPKYHTNTD